MGAAMKARTRAWMVTATTAGLIAGTPVVAALATTKSVSGGTWTYGATGSINYSNYFHPSKKHRSSVQNCSGTYRSTDAAGGLTSRVSESVCLSGNQAYYNVY